MPRSVQIDRSGGERLARSGNARPVSGSPSHGGRVILRVAFLPAYREFEPVSSSWASSFAAASFCFLPWRTISPVIM